MNITKEKSEELQRAAGLRYSAVVRVLDITVVEDPVEPEPVVDPVVDPFVDPLPVE